MNKLARDDLFSLEKYAEVRPEFRARVMAHKQNRRLPIGPNATLYFEDALTMHYQIQEMLRAERIFEASGIQEELDAYNPLIPDGSNWKATFMMEYPDEEERRVQLQKLIGIERHVWAQVGDFARVTPVADEDLERETEEKTSSVHFLRFELTPDMVAAVKQGASISMGIDHPAYIHAVEPVAQNIRDSLAEDLS
ncbi:MAG: DUF3501 family protein [Chromatiaceae bacterium]|jgi:hypothetical protein|nr:DUF3501 family protein [Chromatiaceae bacterium]